MEVRFPLTAWLLATSLSFAAPQAKLAVSTTDALNKLAQLDGRNPALTKEETALLDEAKQGKFDRLSFTEACLIAGGVADSRDRKKYLDQLDRIEAEARKATAGSKSVTEDGARLLKYLHAGPMAKGFNAEQTDLHVLLDTGEFNCVSSAALYTVMGQRLGIDVRAVEVPRHVFSVLATRGHKIDVETTNPRGFDVDPKRNYGPANALRPIESRREVAAPGLAAIVAFNHGVSQAGQKRFADSIRSYLLAVGLDSTNEHSVENLVADLINWPFELAKEGKYEKAIAVLSFGRELAPKEAKIRQNTLAVCDGWAKQYMDRRDWTGAIQIYERGLREYPADEHLTQNLAFCRAQGR